MPDMYEVLGVARDASPAAIKQAYRRLAMQCHPDRPEGSEAAFLPIQTAYEVLGDPARRARYDRTGETEKTSIERTIDERLMQVFGVILNHDDIPGDMIEMATHMVRSSIKEDEVERNRIRIRMRQLTKRSTRLRVKRGENLFLQLAKSEITNCEQQIAHLDEEIDIQRQIINRLEDYEDVVPASQPYVFFDAGTTMP